MDKDEPLEEIREARNRISAQFDHDPSRLVAYYIDLQQQYRDRLVEAAKATSIDNESQAVRIE